MKKKLISILLATSMVLSLVACGGKEDETTEPDKEEIVEVSNEVLPTEMETSGDSSKGEVSENAREMLPEKLVIPEDKAVHFVGTTKQGDASIGIEMTAMEDKESNKTYCNMNLDMDGQVIFISYQEGDDQYFMIDDIEMYKNMLLKEINLEDSKAALAEELGVDASTVTDEMVMDYIEESFAPMVGYSNATETEETESEMNMDYGFTEEDETTLVADYNKENCEIVEEGEDYFVVVYESVYDEQSVKAIVTVSKETGEISRIELEVPETTESEANVEIESEAIEAVEEEAVEVEPVDMEIYIEFTECNWDSLDLSWISKEAEGTAGDVLSRLIMDIFSYAMSMIEVPDEIPDIEGSITIE